MKPREFAEMLLGNKHVNPLFVDAVIEALDEAAYDEDMRFFRENLDSYMVEVER